MTVPFSLLGLSKDAAAYTVELADLVIRVWSTEALAGGTNSQLAATVFYLHCSSARICRASRLMSDPRKLLRHVTPAHLYHRRSLPGIKLLVVNSPILRSLPARAQPLPLNFIASSLSSDIPAEDFLPEHAECWPGDRLVDMFPDSIIFHTSHPKKSSNLFNQWLEQFRDGLSLLCNDDTVLYAFSDGSVLPDKRNRVAAAYRAYRGQQELSRKSISCGRTTSYDAELQGLSLALHYLTSQDATAIYLFCDNESALTSLFDTRLHASQMLSVLACRKARAWLEADPNRTIHPSWCPGHADIEQNEQVDVDAKTAATTTPPIAFISHAYARQQVTAEATKEWQLLAHQMSYCGHGFLANHRLRKVSHIGGGPTLTLTGTDTSLTARFARAVLDHAPTGEYRTRFFPNENPLCNWCPPIQSRRHILSTCIHYVRPRPNFEEFLKNSAEPGPSLVSFLKANPSAFTFTDVPDDDIF
ncbi:hypothetical protein EVG20_g3393 [Dentipellis fragilis]|uniref:RNase H type-1 domain-containing protein n=1 Tax=Dentipellis fragilis TaxID=205917 RepID=A0A4Y9Z4U4_9AGAM|nr:hypothetical protein EVG20_g3393 [Dentipellis fragilis]